MIRHANALCLIVAAAWVGVEARGQSISDVNPGLGTMDASSSPTVSGLAPSGVLPVSEAVSPDLARSVSLSPAAVPGDPEASLALRRKLASDLRRGRREQVAPVPPGLEIEILDPNVDPLGNPAVLTKQDELGRTIVDIPPVVLVHRYYYTGDRSFQGPMLPGGPSIIAVHHPRDGELLYVQTQMLPGAPRVIYTQSTIEYDYGPQSIVLKFGHHGEPSVIYRQGPAFFEKYAQAREQRRERIARWVDRTGATQAYDRVHEGVVNAAGASADGVNAVGRAVASPIVQAVRATPLGGIFTSDPVRQAERERDTMVRRAEAQAAKYTGDIPTIR
jgi:hypothetical protein